MSDTFEKRKREQKKRRKKQDKALRKQERAHDKETRGEGAGVASLEDIVGDIAHPDAREMSESARLVKDAREGRGGAVPAPSAKARRAAEAGRAVRKTEDD